MTRRLTLTRVVMLALVASVGLTFGCGRGVRVIAPDAASQVSGANIAGHIVLENGRAGAGVVVTLETSANGVSAALTRALGRTTAHTSSAPRATVSDPAGRFSFSGLDPGTYVLTGSLRNHQAGVERVAVGAATPQTVYVTLQLLATGSFSGIATLDGIASPRGTIVAINGTSYFAVTDSLGGYALSNVPTGSYSFTAMHDGYAEASVTGTLSTAGQSVLLPAMTLRLSRRIPPVATASFSRVGTVVTLFGIGSDEDGTIAQYQWDFEDDGLIDFTSASTGIVDHTYASGPHRARLTVFDNEGLSANAAVSFTVP